MVNIKLDFDLCLGFLMGGEESVKDQSICCIYMIFQIKKLKRPEGLFKSFKNKFVTLFQFTG